MYVSYTHSVLSFSYCNICCCCCCWGWAGGALGRVKGHKQNRIIDRLPMKGLWWWWFLCVLCFLLVSNWNEWIKWGVGNWCILYNYIILLMWIVSVCVCAVFHRDQKKKCTHHIHEYYSPNNNKWGGGKTQQLTHYHAATAFHTVMRPPVITYVHTQPNKCSRFLRSHYHALVSVIQTGSRLTRAYTRKLHTYLYYTFTRSM